MESGKIFSRHKVRNRKGTRILKQTWVCVLLLPLLNVTAQDNSAFQKRVEDQAWTDLQEAVRKKDVDGIRAAADTLAALKKSKKAPAAATGEAKPGAAAEAKPEHVDLFKRLSDLGFSLSKGPDNGDDKKGATFAFSQDREANAAPVFNANFYLKWQKHLPYTVLDSKTLWLTDAPAISVQGKITSANNTATDAWRFRLENDLTGYNKSKDRLFDGFWATLSFKDESDRNFNVNRLSGEFWFTPNSKKLLIGKYSGKPEDPVQIRWRPYGGLDAGGTLEGSPPNIDNSALWLMAKGRVELRLNFIQKALKLNDVTIYFEDRYVYTEGEERSHNYLTTGIDFEFNDNIGLTFDYTNGEDSPKFVPEEMFKGGLAVKF